MKRGVYELMSSNTGTEFNDFLVWMLGGLSVIVLGLIGVIYNSIKKNVDKLFVKVTKNSEDIAGIESRCEERKGKGE